MPEQKTEQKTQVPAVEELQKQVQEQALLLEKQASVLNNPDVQKTLVRIANNQPVEFSDETSTEEPSTKSMKKLLGRKDNTPEDVDLNSLSNEELVDVLSNVVETYVSTQKEEAVGQSQQTIQELNEKLNQTQDMLLGLVAKQQVREAESAYPDFEQFRPDIQKLVEARPSLSLPEAYKLAKYEHLVKNPSVSHTISEKPESSGTFPQWLPKHQRPVAKENPESKGSLTMPQKPYSSGTKNFKAMVEEAASRRRI